MRLKVALTSALALAFIFNLACKKPAAQPDVLEHADSTRREPNHFLHRTIQVKRSANFSFVVPPHSAIPRLQGTFTSFVPRPGDDPLSDDTTNVDFLLLTPDQYSEFSNGNMGGDALYSTGPTHSHEVDYSLSPTFEEPATYFVVFRSAGGGAPVKSVKADFTVNYGY